jgi:hypothetical protein
MRDALAGATTVDVTSALQEALRQRLRVELEPVHAQGAPSLMTTVIEHVERDAFVVGQPVVGGIVRPLARFERYRIYLSSPLGRVVGETKALGRIKIPAGGDQVLFGYRLARPRDLTVLYRRSEPRMVLRGPALDNEAELCLGADAIAYGYLEDLSPSGARLRLRNDASGQLTTGRTGVLNVTLPAPIGAIDEAVCVLAVEPGDDDGWDVRVSFARRNESVTDALLRTPTARAAAAKRAERRS